MSAKTTLIKLVIPVLIVAAGAGIMILLIASRPAPRTEVKTAQGILVEVMEAQRKDTAVIIAGTGTVEAAREVSVIPQVSGVITRVSPSLRVGAFIEKNEVLFEIEDTDYRLALEQALSARAKAEYDLATTESQARVARQEWEELNKGKDTPPNPLALYEPQLRNARAGLSSADARVEQARLDLERTVLRSPFDVRVRSEDIERGQYVRSGTVAAVLAGTETAEISVPLSLDDLSWLAVPGPGQGKGGAPATVYLAIGGTSHEWQGKVVRSTGEVDTKSRMMELIIEVKDPYGLKRDGSASPPLAAGSFVDVRIRGKTLENVVTLPRRALRDNETVWIMNADNELRVRPVSPLRIEKDYVIIGEGIQEGEKIVMTTISGAANGMRLRSLE